MRLQCEPWFPLGSIMPSRSWLESRIESSLCRCQFVQTDAARMIARVSRRQHISPILQNLPWQPTRRRTSWYISVNRRGYYDRHLYSTLRAQDWWRLRIHGGITEAARQHDLYSFSYVLYHGLCQIYRDAIFWCCWSNTTEWFYQFMQNFWIHFKLFKRPLKTFFIQKHFFFGRLRPCTALMLLVQHNGNIFTVPVSRLVD